MELFGLLCGGLFWGIVILAWVVYVRSGKATKPVFYIGTGVLSALILTLGALVINGLYVGEQASHFYNAASAGDTAEVERLIEAGEDVNGETDKLGWFPLMGASWSGHADIVALLLRHHADPNHKNSRGETALQYALDNHHPDVVRLLQAAGAKE